MPKPLEENFRDWESDTFGFGYGTGEPHTISALRKFLENCPHDGGYDYASLETALSPTVAWLLINTLAAHSILEYGGSPRYAWLSLEGKRLRTFVLSKTIDELIQIVCDYDDDYAHCHPDGCNCGPFGYEKGRVCQNPFWPRRAPATP